MAVVYRAATGGSKGGDDIGLISLHGGVPAFLATQVVILQKS